MMKELNLCDVHYHYNPSSIPGDKAECHDWDILRNLNMIVQCDIRKSLLSYPVWLPELTEPGKRDMCRRINEEYAGLSAVHPSLEAFALLPYSNECSIFSGICPGCLSFERNLVSVQFSGDMFNM